MRNLGRLVITASLVVIFASLVVAQGVPAPGQQAPPTVASQPALPPATKLEGFQPEAGSVMTVGYDELGRIGYPINGVTVDVRAMQDTKGSVARGLLVEVTQSEYRKEQSFVDADEIPELLNGLDALVAVKANPTQFKMFEVRYTTRGGLQLVAFNDKKAKISYAVQVGRTLKAQKFLDEEDLLRLRGLFNAAARKLDSAK